MADQSSTSFCAVPWINISIDVNGSVRPCCKFIQPDEDDKNNLGNLQSSALSEIWNGPKLQALRQEFLDGKKPSGCKSCWDEEKSGIVSLRQNFVAGRVDPKTKMELKTSVAAGPLAVDLKLSQKCNFKCRICGPIASSAFFEEEAKHDPHFHMGEKQQEYLNGFKLFGRQVDLDWLRQNLAHLQHVELYGGEPLLGKENRLLEDLLIDNGYSGKVSLHYNTNASLFDPTLIEKWKKFRRVTVCLSVDDIGPRFEYQRFPGKWNIVEKNVQKYRALMSGQLRLSLFCSVSVLNVFTLNEYIDWTVKTCPDIELIFNLVHSREIFNISCMTPALKKLAVQKLDQWLGHYPEAIDTQLRAIKEFVQSGPSAKNMKELANELLYRDQIRKQDFGKLYPEIESLVLQEGVAT